MPYIGRLGYMGLAKESAPGIVNATMDNWIAFNPPESITPTIKLLEHTGIAGKPDLIIKANQGPGNIPSAKFNFNMEPENIGEVLMAAFGTDIKTGAGPDYIHTYSRLANAQLPTYSFFLDKGAAKPLYAGAMLNKLTIDAKAGDYVKADADFVALRYDRESTGVPVYSTLKPFTFNEVAVNFAGSGVEVDYDNIKIEIDNMVKAEHALSSSIWPNKIYSEGFRVTIAADFFVENTTEYAKFLAGTNTSLVITLTSSEIIPTTAVPYSLTFNLPVGKYSAAPYQLQAGVLKIPFSLVGIYDTSTTKTLNAILVNGKSAAY